MEILKIIFAIIGAIYLPIALFKTDSDVYRTTVLILLLYLVFKN